MYNHFINTFIDAQTAAHRHYSAVAATERRLFGASGDQAVRVPATHEVIAELRHAYETLAARIIAKARRQFSRGEAQPVVNRQGVFSRAGFDIERSLTLGEVPDFDRLWAVLEAQLGGIGAAAGEQQ
ncbi:hypothetical protein PQR37_18870 [Paraburkholderia nemoris]|uniref:hypothetical protein n=1 Tax=Paraburkholderia nemoris TaxID=2793076 RepID=UPI0038BB5485